MDQNHVSRSSSYLNCPEIVRLPSAGSGSGGTAGSGGGEAGRTTSSSSTPSELVNLNLTDRVRIFLFASFSDASPPRGAEHVLAPDPESPVPVGSSVGEDLLRADTGSRTGTGTGTETDPWFEEATVEVEVEGKVEVEVKEGVILPPRPAPSPDWRRG